MKQPKEATSVRLTSEARQLLQCLSEVLGLSQAGVLETIIRERAKREKLTSSQERPSREASRVPVRA